MRIIYVYLLLLVVPIALRGQETKNSKTSSIGNVLSFDVGYTRSDYNFGFDDIIIDYVTNENNTLVIKQDTLYGAKPKANGLHLGVNYDRWFSSHWGIFANGSMSYIFPIQRQAIIGDGQMAFDSESSIFLGVGLNVRFFEKNNHSLRTAIGFGLGHAFSSSMDYPISDYIEINGDSSLVINRGWLSDDSKSSLLGFTGKLIYDIPLKSNNYFLSVYYKVIITPSSRLRDPLFLNHQTGVSFNLKFRK
ncbi:MAG: hypothetical protein R2753_08370 [Chitinophagales bacterium]